MVKRYNWDFLWSKIELHTGLVFCVFWRHGNWTDTRNLCRFLVSGQIPGFWNPMVKWFNWDFLWSKIELHTGLDFCVHRTKLFTPGHVNQLTSSDCLRWDDCSLVGPCLIGDTGIEPTELDFWSTQDWVFVSTGEKIQMIPGFWNPMVKWFNWDFLWSKIDLHKGIEPVDLDFWSEKIPMIPSFWNPMVKWYNRDFLWSKIELHGPCLFGDTGIEPVGLDFWSEKIPIASFYCADSWFLESNGKMVQLGFSLIKNRAPQTKCHEYWFARNTKTRHHVRLEETNRTNPSCHGKHWTGKSVFSHRDKTHKADVCTNLRCSASSSNGGCGAKLVGPIRMSSKFPTLRDCLRELGWGSCLPQRKWCVDTA